MSLRGGAFVILTVPSRRFPSEYLCGTTQFTGVLGLLTTTRAVLAVTAGSWLLRDLARSALSDCWTSREGSCSKLPRSVLLADNSDASSEAVIRCSCIDLARDGEFFGQSTCKIRLTDVDVAFISDLDDGMHGVANVDAQRLKLPYHVCGPIPSRSLSSRSLHFE